MEIPKGMFSGIGNAKALLESEYIKPGTYWLRIDRNKIDKNRKGLVFAAIEMTVVRVLDDLNGTGHRIGNSVTHLVMQANDYFLSEIKSFIGNVMGIQPEQISEDHANLVFGPDQPLAGTVVEMQARNVVTQAGKDFTRIVYKREVPAAEVLEALDKDTVVRFFPNDILERTITAEQQQAAS